MVKAVVPLVKVYGVVVYGLPMGTYVTQDTNSIFSCVIHSLTFSLSVHTIEVCPYQTSFAKFKQ